MGSSAATPPRLSQPDASTQRIAAIYFLDLCRRVSFLQKCARKTGELRNIVEPFGRALDAIKIRADADRVDSGDLLYMINMRDNGGQRSTNRGILGRVGGKYRP